MKRYYYFTLILLALIVSCKEKDVSLADQVAGLYDYYEGYIPDLDKNGSQPLGKGGITIEAIGKDLIKIRINNQSRRIWDFPECQITEVNNGGKRIYPFFYAVIIDRKTNTEIAQVRDHFSSPSIPLRLRIDFNFVDSKNDRLMLESIKR